MLRIVRLTVENIGPFREKQTVAFPEKGLVLIEGQFTDREGSSGAGKSSVMEAVAWVLGFGDASNKDMLHWGQAAGSATLEMEAFGESLQITRTVSESGSKLTLSGSKVQAKNSNKDASEKLWQALRMQSTVLSAMTHQGQQTKTGRSGLDFWSLSDDAKKSFLADVLGLVVYENAAKHAKESALLTNRQLETEQAVLKELMASPMEEAELPAEPEPWDEAAYEEKRKEKLLAIQEYRIKHKEKQEEVEYQLVEWRKKLEILYNKTIKYQELITAEENKIKEYENQYKLAKQEADNQRRFLQSKLSEITQKGTRKKDEKAEITKHIIHLESKKCPTCDQSWVENEEHLSNKKKQLENVQKELESLAKEYRKYNKELEEIPTIEYNPPQEPHNRIKEIKDSHREKLKKEKEEIEANLAMLKEPPFDDRWLQSDLQDLEKKRVNHQHKVSQHKMQIEHWQKWETRRKKIADDIAVKKQKIADLEQQADWAGALAEALGQKGFLGAIFDEMAEEISNEANGYLSRIPNVSQCSVQVVSESQTESGKVKRKLGLRLTVRGQEVPAKSPYLSGGQQRALFLCLDLALRAVLQRRMGIVVGWVFMDEPMDGLGESEKQAFIDIFEEIDALVLVIDHSTEVKDSFYQKIVVVNDGNQSFIKTEGL